MTNNLEKIFPIIKGDLTDEPKSERPTFIVSQEQSPLSKSYVSGLIIFYGIDNGNQFVLLKNDFLKILSIDQVHSLAIKNLITNAVKSILVHGDWNDIVMITCGNSLESSLILIDSIWKAYDNYVEEDIIIAIPKKDLLILCDSANKEKIEKLKQISNKYFFDNKLGSITNRLFIRKNNNWENYPT